MADDNYISTWPLIIQNIEILKISELLQMEIEPYVVIMNQRQVNSYDIQDIISENPELKHYMYAGQWFLFSIVLGLIICGLILEKNHKSVLKKGKIKQNTIKH